MTKSIGIGSYDANGNVLIKTKVYSNSNFKGTVHIDDSTGKYLSNRIDVNL